MFYFPDFMTYSNTQVFANCNKKLLTTRFIGFSYNGGVIAGSSAGSSGQEPPVAVNIDALVGSKEPDDFTPPQNIENILLNQRTYDIRVKREDVVDTESSAYRAGVVVGYVAGLEKYVLQKGLLPSRGITSNVLFLQNAWQAYAQGIALEAPPRPSSYELLESLGLKVLKLSLGPNLDSESQRAGYHLGFAVRIMRQYGVALQEWEIPSTQAEYDAFMRGMNEEERGSEKEICLELNRAPLQIQDLSQLPNAERHPTDLNALIPNSLLKKNFNSNKIPLLSSLNKDDATTSLACIRNTMMYETGMRVRAAAQHK